jgi:hypothetical protein
MRTRWVTFCFIAMWAMIAAILVLLWWTNRRIDDLLGEVPVQVHRWVPQEKEGDTDGRPVDKSR